MSGAAARSPRLLHADEEQLDRAALLLQSGTAFVVAVCPRDLQAGALARLRSRAPGIAVPGPVAIDDAGAMLEALAGQAKQRDRVLSVAIGKDAGSALDGLNLHREKVLAGGPVVLWLDDVKALTNMRTRAPDAFSFRSTMALVRGDGGPLPESAGGEPDEVVRARKRLKRAKTPLERAAAGWVLAEKLRSRHQTIPAESAARAALDAAGQMKSEDAPGVRASICASLSRIAWMKGRESERLAWIERALAENAQDTLAGRIEAEVYLRTSFPGPTGGLDRASIARAVELMTSHGLGPEARAQALRGAMNLARLVGDLRTARLHLRERLATVLPVPAIDRGHAWADFALIEARAGELAAAVSRSREAVVAVAAEGGLAIVELDTLRSCLLDQGEVDAALDVTTRLALEDHRSGQVDDSARVELELGRTDAALLAGRGAVRSAVARGADGDALGLLADLVIVVEQAHEAERWSAARIDVALGEVSRCESLLLTLAAPGRLPWQPIRIMELRARLLALRSDTRCQATDAAGQAVDLARTTCPDLLPETGRLRADILLRDERPDESLAVVADIEPEAAARGFLEERARLLANRVLALVQRADPPSTIVPHLAALREALAATDSPRITAETLRDLAKRLPPTCTTPDPHALAEEALGLFVAMPMPAQEARCLEIMGDALRARGSADEARRRYLTARARLERYGLGLRLPLLSRKIDALA